MIVMQCDLEARMLYVKELVIIHLIDENPLYFSNKLRVRSWIKEKKIRGFYYKDTLKISLMDLT